MRGVILAGGGATRFGGRPKGLVEVGGERCLDRVARALEQALGAAPLLVANAPDAATWRPDLNTMPDLLPGHGVLGGLLTAVEAGPGPALVVAWDMPFVTPSLLADLAAHFESTDAVLPWGPGPDGMEPLCAVYGPASGPAIRRALARGERRAIAFHPDIRLTILPPAVVRVHGDPAVLFFNLNTPDDLHRAEQLWRHASSPS